MSILSSIVLIISVFIIISILFPKNYFFPRNNLDKCEKNKHSISKILCKIVFYNQKVFPKKYLFRYSKLIDNAFLANDFTPYKLLAVQEGLTVLFYFLFIPFYSANRLSLTNLIFLPVIAGFLLPIFFVTRRGRVRKEKIINSIPFFADLLTLSCEAGLDIFATLINIVENTERTPMHSLIENIIKKIQMGKSRQEALKLAYDQTNIWDLKTIYMTILQAERMGTPIGESLRNQVELMRKTRLNRAEKKAQEAPLKLLIPMLLFIFPVTFVVILSPLFLRFVNGSLF